MKKTHIYQALILLAVFLAGCDDFLSEQPEANKGEITTIEQLEGLLAKGNWSGEAQFDPNRAMMFCTDCFDLRPEYYSGGLKEMGTGLDVAQLSVWEMEYIEDANQMVSKWHDEFQAVYRANLILEYVDKVSGSQERKEKVKMKAHLVRAYSYYELAQHYCMPYGESTLDEPGLPIKRSTSYEEDLKRASLKDTYDFIEKDILEAVKLDEPLFVNGKRYSWKETGATANALAARFYMAKHDYENAQKHAEEALTYGNDISDYNTDIEQSLDPFGVPTLNIRSISKIQDIVDYDRSYYYRLTAYLFESVWMIPSDGFLSLFDRENAYDLRYRYFYWPDGQDWYLFAMFEPPFNPTVPIWMQYDVYIPATPNVAEMMLIRAECMARRDRVADAMAALNDFRKYRFATDTPAGVLNLAATDKNTAVRLILEERTREFPFTLRWNDIRRINFNDDPNDDVTLTKRFYPVTRYVVEDNAAPIEYTLGPSSRNYAVAIPSGEIVSSNHAIVQNKY